MRPPNYRQLKKEKKPQEAFQTSRGNIVGSNQFNHYDAGLMLVQSKNDTVELIFELLPKISLKNIHKKIVLLLSNPVQDKFPQRTLWN